MAVDPCRLGYYLSLCLDQRVDLDSLSLARKIVSGKDTECTFTAALTTPDTLVSSSINLDRPLRTVVISLPPVV
jgi:hypothetical protein